MKNIPYLVLLLILLAGCEPCQAHRLGEFSDEEVAALVILGEARCQGEIGMKAVAQVILNRARASKTSVKAVCLQPYQFSCLNAVSGRRMALKAESERVTEIAECLAAFICNDIDVLEGFEANHYYNASLCSPSWAKGQKGVRIGDHTFLEL